MGLSGWVHNHYATKRKPCLSEFLSAKSFVVTQKHFPPGWFDWEDGFSSLTLRFKNQILAIFGVLGLLCTAL